MHQGPGRPGQARLVGCYAPNGEPEQMFHVKHSETEG